jgi:hypothetical protein
MTKISDLKIWIIRKLGGAVFAERTHRYSIETRYGRYVADKVKCHPGGAVEWWSEDPSYGRVHTIITESGIEIADNEPDGDFPCL